MSKSNKKFRNSSVTPKYGTLDHQTARNNDSFNTSPNVTPAKDDAPVLENNSENRTANTFVGLPGPPRGMPDRFCLLATTSAAVSF